MILFIIFGLIFVLIFLIAFKILKKLLKALVTAILLIIILLSLITVIVYIDAKKLTKAIQGPKEIFVLSGSSLSAGGYIKTNDFTKDDIKNLNIFQYYNKTYLDESEDLYLVPKPNKPENLVLLIYANYLVKDQTMSFEEYDVEIGEIKLAELLQTNNLEESAEIFASKSEYDSETILKELSEEYENSEELKASLMLSLLSTQQKEDGNYIFNGIKKDEIIIFPDFITLKVLDFLPESITNKIMQ